MDHKDEGTPIEGTSLYEEDLLDIIEEIKNGAKSPADVLGFGPEVLNSIEKIAIGYFGASMFAKAATLYGFVLRLDPNRSTAWRGLGACCHTKRQYPAAAECYRFAVNFSPTDVACKVYLGECLCHMGQPAEGVKILEEAVALGAKTGTDPTFVARAKAIIKAGGGIPPPAAIIDRSESGSAAAKDSGSPTAKGKNPSAAEQSGAQAKKSDKANSEAPTGAAAGGGSSGMSLEDMKRNPAMAADLEYLRGKLLSGDLTLAQVGGFGENELEGAYVCACKYVELNDYTRAFQILAWLMFMDPYKGRYYQLLGIIMQRNKSYAAAEQYYSMALEFEPDEPMTLIYRGEARIMGGHRDEGVGFIKRGIEVAQGNTKYDDVVKRGQILLRQFST